MTETKGKLGPSAAAAELCREKGGDRKLVELIRRVHGMLGELPYARVDAFSATAWRADFDVRIEAPGWEGPTRIEVEVARPRVTRATRESLLWVVRTMRVSTSTAHYMQGVNGLVEQEHEGRPANLERMERALRRCIEAHDQAEKVRAEKRERRRAVEADREAEDTADREAAHGAVDKLLVAAGSWAIDAASLDRVVVTVRPRTALAGTPRFNIGFNDLDEETAARVLRALRGE